MTRPVLLVLRPEPGASATAARAAAFGMTAIEAPLFTAHALTYTSPDSSDYDALMMTSANAARLGGAGLARYAHLPAYAVGDATAAAMRDAGISDVMTGPGDADALAGMIAAGPHRRLLHLCGEHHRVTKSASALAIDHLPVYRSAAVAALPAAARDVLQDGAVALLHSPRAASLLAMLVDDAGLDRTAIRLVAISPAAATAAGPGWRSLAIAPAPTDADMLACARMLCDKLPQ